MFGVLVAILSRLYSHHMKKGVELLYRQEEEEIQGS